MFAYFDFIRIISSIFFFAVRVAYLISRQRQPLCKLTLNLNYTEAINKPWGQSHRESLR